MTLTATDDANGSGIKSITYSATGGQPIAETTVNGSSTSIVISGEGVTTLSFYATDNAGNTSDVGTHTVKLDKTAPEAFLRFDPARKDFALFGRDATSGTSAGAVSPSFVRRQSTGDKNRRAENRTYDLIDAAGNTLQLVVSVGLTKDDAVAAFQSFQYRGGNVVRPPYNVLFAEWKLKKNAFDELKQTAIVTFPSQRADALWKAKDNRTRITTPSGTTTVPGMFLIRMASSNGGVSIETTP